MPIKKQPLFRGVNRIASQMQDSTSSSLIDASNQLDSQASSISSLQAQTAAGMIANGVLVSQVMPVTGTYQLVTHNLGRVASGFAVVDKPGALDVWRDGADPGAVYNTSTQPTKNNPTPTKTIRLQSSLGSTVIVKLWIF